MKVLCNDPFNGELQMDRNSVILVRDYETIVNIHGASASQMSKSSSQNSNSSYHGESQKTSKESVGKVNTYLI